MSRQGSVPSNSQNKDTSDQNQSWQKQPNRVKRPPPVKNRARNGQLDRMEDAIATAEVLVSLGHSEAQAVASELDDDNRISFARAFCTAVLTTLWGELTNQSQDENRIREPVVSPIKGYSGLVNRIAESLARVAAPRAGYLIGRLYTALLPAHTRKTLGAYYTPPPLVDRLLELVDQAELDWRKARVIDPACGGAAFLASVAPRMVRLAKGTSALDVLEDLESRLVGIEVDPFAAWMSMVLLDIAMLQLITNAGRPMKPVVLARDALDINLRELGGFDLVVGNPPYGRIGLTSSAREKFRQSLFGHANLYGIFTDLAVRLASLGGLIAFVTPTSFLGGEYFKNLRKLLIKEAPLVHLEFIHDRQGVFDGVLQETTLALFRRSQGPAVSKIRVNVLQVREPTEPVVPEIAGTVTLDAPEGGPWLLPRSADHQSLIRRLHSMSHRLCDYGFAVSTGQLVWNRHKPQLRARFERDCYPIIWAEAVNTDGTFHFQAVRRTHLPYFRIQGGQDFLINHEPCILVQRTTSKEQQRRLVAAVIPNSFIVEYPGFVVENHLNMIYSLSRKPQVALRTLMTLLNSTTLDQVFRCINGSVAVSAYELNSIPLPHPKQLEELQTLVFAREGMEAIEQLIASFYSPDEQTRATASRYPCQQHRTVAA
jgi:adenine-specific DNA-methyltransferase